MTSMFSSVKMGDLTLKNRVFMAPLTRNRAHNESAVPSGMAKTYYAQRASAGLIISEASQVSPMGKGYVGTPGIYDEAQVRGWKEINDAVHAEGGKIFMQLWHVGRISHTSLLPDNQKPLAPSAIRAEAQTYTQSGMADVSEPKAMTEDEIKQTIADYKHAAQCAKDAGFDGIEVHAANGYLIDQFIRDKTNQRTDNYGGSIENRARFLFEVLDAVLEIWPAGKVGIRLSPTGTFNDIADSAPEKTFGTIITKLNDYNLAYLHMVERFPGIGADNKDIKIIEDLLKLWNGFYIANGDYDAMRAQDAVDAGHADAITFGRPFIANPDLPKRLEIGAELNEPDQDTFYGGGKEGYIDYPFLEGSEAA